MVVGPLPARSAAACWGGTIGAGWVNCVIGTFASAAVMKLCQVIAGQVPPNTGYTPLTRPIDVAWLALTRRLMHRQPDPIELAEAAYRLEKVLGVAGTARTWKVVDKLVDLAG